MAGLTQQILELAQKGPASVFDPIALRVGIDLDLVDIALAHGELITLDEFAVKTKANPYLLQRVIRLLIPLNIFAEPTPGTYATTPLSPSLATGAPSKPSIIRMIHIYRTTPMIPDYLAANNYQNLVFAYDGPFNFAHDWYKGNYFDFMVLPGNERLSAAFNKAMEMQKGHEDVGFQSQYLADERKVHSDPECILFVDGWRRSRPSRITSVEAKLDWLMFCLGALERTEKQWAELADSVGMKVNGIWLDDGAFIGILELGKK
ncbi:hypothetical protein GQ44DRAFT_732611 [Phaeosphaeriaceae sp. PMI808]|nr:hypothetical protein GQ44DRAFT_732611 [Phaeosphaeriaceae sp. PMI808]